jgi:vacuolar protein sorting-associated protein IST1
MLMQKFGRTFALSVVNNDPPCVPPRVLSKLAIYVPPPELVDMYLQEIARGYGINWTSDRLKQEEVEEEVPVTESVEDAGKSVDKDEQTPKVSSSTISRATLLISLTMSGRTARPHQKRLPRRRVPKRS